MIIQFEGSKIYAALAYNEEFKMKDCKGNAS
jgi:hypothetical protein